MNLADFKVGLRFCCGDRLWLCTDVGTRVAVAVRIDHLVDDSHGSDAMTNEGGPAPPPGVGSSWLAGPPYAVTEIVFDEHDMPGCEVAK